MGQFGCVCISCLLVLLLVIFNNLSHLKSSPVRDPLAHMLQSTVVSNMEAKHIHEKWKFKPPEHPFNSGEMLSEAKDGTVSQRIVSSHGSENPSIKENLQQPHRDYTS